MPNNEFGTVMAAIFILVWMILGGMYYIHPFLPLLVLTTFWGFTLGLNLGLGGRSRLVILHCTILPVAVGFAGYKLSGWQGGVTGLLLFADMLDFAFMVALVTAITSWKAKSLLMPAAE